MVAELGSFSRAADRLNTTQPNVSGRIARLEETLGCTLFERGASTFALTTAGRDLLAHAREVLTATESFLIAANKPALFGGVLKLGVTELILHTWLRTFLNRFHQSLPEVVVELDVDVSRNLDRALADRSIDLAFHNAPFETPGCIGHTLGSYPFVWVAAQELASVSSDAPSPLLDKPVLSPARNTLPHTEIAAHIDTLSRNGLPKPRLVTCGSLTASRHMALDGMGIAALPEAMVHEDLASSRLQAIDCGWVPSALAFHARYPDTAAAHTSASAVATAIDVAAAHSLE